MYVKCVFLVKASQNISISWPVSNAPDSSSRIFTKWHSREPMKSLQFASSDDVSPSARLQISISQRATLSQWAPSNELLSGQWRGSTTGKRWRLIYRRAAHEWQSRQTEHTRNTEERNRPHIYFFQHTPLRLLLNSALSGESLCLIVCFTLQNRFEDN